MRNNNKIEGERWLKQAREDLKVAKWSSMGNFYANTCFMAQQASEKALKAYCYLQGERQVLGHSLLELLRRCFKYDRAFKALEKESKKLDKYYIISRYPNGLPGLVPSEYFDKDEAKESIRYAEKIIKSVEGRFSNI
jgi:HEPN domain-containing protein